MSIAVNQSISAGSGDFAYLRGVSGGFAGYVLNKSWTHAHWVYPDTGGDGVAFARPFDASYATGLCSYQNGTSDNWGYAWMYLGGGNLNPYAGNWVRNAWNHLCATYDITTGVFSVYLNGGTPTTESVGTGITTSLFDFSYGCDSTTGADTEQFFGRIAEGGLWVDYVMPPTGPDSITSLQTLQAQYVKPSKLLMCHTMLDVATGLTDITGNGYDLYVRSNNSSVSPTPGGGGIATITDWGITSHPVSIGGPSGRVPYDTQLSGGFVDFMNGGF